MFIVARILLGDDDDDDEEFAVKCNNKDGSRVLMRISQIDVYACIYCFFI